MTSDGLRLALYRGASAEIITLADYLALEPGGRRACEVSPSWSTMSLVAGGDERWGAQLSLGALGLLVAQLPQARSRLEAGQRAVIRSAVFDVPQALFLLFEPEDGAAVATLAMTDELPATSWLPHEPPGGQLYAFVEEHRQRLVDAGTAGGIVPQTLGLASLCADLAREAELGQQVVALLGEGFF